MKNEQEQQRNKRTGFGMILVLLVGMLGGVGLQVKGAEGVLGLIPDSAPAFVVLKDPRGLSDTVAALNHDLGLNHPMMGDLLMMLKMQLGIGEGLDEGGEIALVMTKLMLPPAEPEVMLLVPVSDYAEFAKGFGVVDAAGIASIQLGPKQSFMKEVGGYAVISDKEDRVKAFEGGGNGKWSEYGGEFGGLVAGGSSLVVGMDLVQVGPVMQPLVALGVMQMKQQVEAGGAAMPESQRQSLETFYTMLDVYAKGINGALRDGQALLVGLSLDMDGVGLNGSIQFKEGTELAGAFSGNAEGNGRVEVLGAPGGGGEPGFDRLPNQPFMLAVSMDMRSLPYETWLNELVDFTEPGTGMHDYMVSFVEAYADIKVMQQAMYPPTAGGAAPSLLSMVSVIESAAPADVLGGLKGFIKAMDGLDMGTGVKYDTEYTEGAKEIGGHSIDSYQLNMEMSPEMMAQMGMMSMFMQSLTNFDVTTTEDSVVMASSSDEVLMKAALGVEGGGLEQNELLAGVRSELYPHRVMEGYMGVGTVAEAALQMMAFFMPGAKLEVPADLPPIGFGVSVNDGGAGKRLYLPMPLVKALFKMGMEAQQMFVQPGPGGGGQSL